MPYRDKNEIKKHNRDYSVGAPRTEEYPRRFIYLAVVNVKDTSDAMLSFNVFHSKNYFYIF